MFYYMLQRENTYSGKNAANYALTYALEPNPKYRFFASYGDGGGDCSNFVSQCLAAGGAQMVFGSSYPWWYREDSLNHVHDSWSVSWAVAHSLYWCLKMRGINNLSGIKGREVTDISELELGDIIQYENDKRIIYHSAVVTGFVTEKGVKEPLISQHSFNGGNVYYFKDAAKKMHFMKIQI